MDDDDDTQVYKDDGNLLLIAYQSGFHDGKKAALARREWNFCERCGKRTADLTVIHTCTPPQEKKTDDDDDIQVYAADTAIVQTLLPKLYSIIDRLLDGQDKALVIEARRVLPKAYKNSFEKGKSA